MLIDHQALLDAIVKKKMEEHEVNITLSAFVKPYSVYQGLTDKRSHEANSIYAFVDGGVVTEGGLVSGRKANVDLEFEFVLIQSAYDKAFSEAPLLKLASICRSLFDLNDRLEYRGQYSEQALAAFELFKKTYAGNTTQQLKLKVSLYYLSKGSERNAYLEEQIALLEHEILKKLPKFKTNVYFLDAETLVKREQKQPSEMSKPNSANEHLKKSNQVSMVLTNLSECYDLASSEDT